MISFLRINDSNNRRIPIPLNHKYLSYLRVLPTSILHIVWLYIFSHLLLVSFGWTVTRLLLAETVMRRFWKYSDTGIVKFTFPSDSGLPSAASKFTLCGPIDGCILFKTCEELMIEITGANWLWVRYKKFGKTRLSPNE